MATNSEMQTGARGDDVLDRKEWMWKEIGKNAQLEKKRDTSNQITRLILM